jgi:NADPH:quinone reductase-like Zn-dependent oxidoreductase
MTESAEKVFDQEESVSGAKVSAPAMRAVRIHRFGGVEVIVDEELPRPIPAQGQVLVRVKAAGVGPWDAWIRNGKSVLPQPLPLTLGSDLSGVIESLGPGVSGVQRGVPQTGD